MRSALIRRIARPGLIPMLSAMLSSMFFAALPAAASDLERLPRYFERLRDLGLHAVGERFAMDRLHQPELQPAERAQLTIELSRCYEAHSQQVETEAEQRQLQNLADSVLDALLTQPGSFPRREAVEFQRLILAADRASSLAWEAQIDPDDTDSARVATASVTAAIQTLSKWSAAAGEASNSVPSASDAASGGLSSRDFRRLRREAEVRSVLLSIELADIGQSPVERASAIVTAQERLDRVRKSGPDPQWDWPLRIGALRLARLEGNASAFAAQVRQLLQSSPAPTMRAAIIAEQIRQLLDDRDPAKALSLLREQAGEGKEVTDELRTLQVEATLALWEKAPGDRKSELWAAALEQQSRITTGWSRRSAALIDVARDAAEFGAAAARHVRAARTAYRQGDRRGAAQLYLQAREVALQEDRADAADQLALIRASILFEDGDFLTAMEAGRPVAAGNGPRAAQASLLIAYCHGRVADSQPSDAADHQYRQSLVNHLARFSLHETAGEAAWMLGLFLEHQQQLTDALEAYERVPLEHARSSAALQRQAEVLAAVLESLRKSSEEGFEGRTATEWRRTADDVLQNLIERLPTGPAAWDATQGALALAVARLELLSDPPRYGSADGRLDGVLAASEAESRQARAEGRRPDPAWSDIEQQARALRVVSLAGQQRFQEAEARLKALPEEDSDELLSVFSGLSGASAGLSAGDRDKLGRIELNALDRLNARRDQLSPAERRRLDHSRAEALVATDKSTEAIALYESLLREEPENQDLLRTLGRLIDQRARPDDPALARSYWQRLERHSKPGSPEWFEARYSIAAGFLSEGKAADARKLISVTRIVYPSLGGEDWKRRFQTLDEAAKQTPPAAPRRK